MNEYYHESLTLRQLVSDICAGRSCINCPLNSENGCKTTYINYDHPTDEDINLIVSTFLELNPGYEDNIDPALLAIAKSYSIPTIDISDTEMIDMFGG